MAKKRKPAYLKILEGMNCCYGGLDERDCSRCPYDKYNDTGMFGEGGAYCMLKLNEDAKKWAESMEMFTNCRECVCYKPEMDSVTWKPSDHGHCSTWNCDVLETEYCSRGAMKDE